MGMTREQAALVGRDLMQRADTDRDGHVTVSEFMAARSSIAAGLRQPQPQPQLQQPVYQQQQQLYQQQQQILQQQQQQQWLPSAGGLGGGGQGTYGGVAAGGLGSPVSAPAGTQLFAQQQPGMQGGFPLGAAQPAAQPGALPASSLAAMEEAILNSSFNVVDADQGGTVEADEFEKMVRTSLRSALRLRRRR